MLEVASDTKTDTKTKILDAAQKLFGDKGFEATSLRDITTEAKVNLAAINYHFQSKDSLIGAVIDRCIGPVNQRRLEMLDAAGPAPSLERIVEAFVQPTLEADWATVVPLMGRILATPERFLGSFFRKRISQIAERFMTALAQALPDLPPTELMWRLHFMAGGVAQILLFSRVLPVLSGGICDLTDRAALGRRMVAYFSAGYRAPLPETTLAETTLAETN